MSTRSHRPRRHRSRVAVRDHRYDDLSLELGDDVIELVTRTVGLVLTHRLTAEERAAGMVAFAPDLLPFKELDEELAVDAPGGGTLEHEHLGTTTCAWAGPDGWLEGFAEGDLLALSVSDLLGLGVTVVDGEPDQAAELVRDAFGLLRDGGDTIEPVSLAELARAVADTELADRPTRAPFGERVAAAGFEVRDEHVAPAGFDWPAWERNTKVARLADAYGLSPTDEPKILAVLDLAAADPPREPAALAAAAAELTDPNVAQLLADDLLGADGPGGVTELASELVEHAGSGAARGAARWLLARALEADGDVLGAERELEEAVALSPTFGPALEDLASYAGDRGDAKRTLDLLLRAGADSRDPSVVDLRDLVARSAGRAGRNDPCPCGSGKKFKACHWGQERMPLERRIGWLWNKAAAFAQRGPAAIALLDIARAYAGPVATNRTVIDLAFGDGVVLDIALHEGGAFDRFLAARGVLLPDDERALAEQWRSTVRAVYAVAAVRRGEGVDLDDLATGERYTVVDRLASRTVAAGALVALRLVPDGTGAHQIVGGGTVVRPEALDELRSALAGGLDAVDTAFAIGIAAAR